MAKGIWICSRKTLQRDIEKKLHLICEKIAPDNITPNPPAIRAGNNNAFAVMNPNNSLLFKHNSLLMGMIIGDDTNWEIPFNAFPDGSFAAFRDGDQHCEIIADPAASRTVWFYFDKDYFIASTSQRAIILFLGSFKFNEEILAWILSSGSLGPDHSWDKRIQRLPPNSSVILDKNKWEIKKNYRYPVFEISSEADVYHEQKYQEILHATFESMHFNPSDWILALSGGYDSRTLLCFLPAHQNIQDIKTITWGLKSSVENKNNDAYLARQLANHFKMEHNYYTTDLPNDSAEKILNRFLLNGEGRIDHISGYSDGFKMWENIYMNEAKGILRGDIGLTNKNATSPMGVRLMMAMGKCSDFSNLKPFADYFPEQRIPEYLVKKENETLAQWRDRLFLSFHNTTVVAALSDMKLSYVEQVCPLLSRKILAHICQMPDHLRTNKALLKKVAQFVSPKIPYANRIADARPTDILRDYKVVEVLMQELESDSTVKLFPENLLNYVSEKIQPRNEFIQKLNPQLYIRKKLKRILPQSLKNAIKDNVPSSIMVDPYVLAFRIFIASRMYSTLNEDVTAKGRQTKDVVLH